MLALVGVVALGPAAARGQDADWVVVVAGIGADLGPAERAANRVVEHLRASGESVLTGATLRDRMRERVSSPFEPLRPRDLEELASSDEGVMELVALGSNDQARGMAGPVLREADTVMAAIGRDDAAARHVQNICLYAVRAFLASNRAAEARVQAVECHRLLPGLVPERHPPNVLALYREVGAAIAASGNALVVEAPDVDAGSCAVRVQGRQVATSLPARVAVTPGAYAVQLECAVAGAGRVHRVTAESGETRVQIDAALQSALATSDEPKLRYASADDQTQSLARHVGVLGRGLGAANVLVVRAASSSAVSFERYRIGPGRAERVAEAMLELTVTECVPIALDALTEGRSMRAEECSGGAVTAHSQSARDEGPSLVPPLILGAAGVGALAVAGYGAFFVGGCVQPDVRAPDGCARREEREWLGIGVWAGLGALAVGGAVLWVALSSSGDDEGEPAVGLWPGGVELRGAF